MAAPEGNNNYLKGKAATRALEHALDVRSGDAENTKKVEAWDKQIDKAVRKGDLAALNAIMDRVEGRPTQKQELSTPDGPLEVKQWTIQPVKPSDNSSGS